MLVRPNVTIGPSYGYTVGTAGFRTHFATFPTHSSLVGVILCLISMLLFPCGSVLENTRALDPHFL